MDIRTEHDFIKSMWLFMKKHRIYTDLTWTEGDELLKRYEDIPYAPEMIKAYLDHLPEEGDN